jgi:hypothetical protein
VGNQPHLEKIGILGLFFLSDTPILSDILGLFLGRCIRLILGTSTKFNFPRELPWKELEPGNKARYDQHEAIGTRSSVVPRLF